MLSKQNEFKLFCLDRFAAHTKREPIQVLEQFEQSGLFDYLDENYEVLHTQGEAFLMSEIEQYLQNHVK